MRNISIWKRDGSIWMYMDAYEALTEAYENMDAWGTCGCMGAAVRAVCAVRAVLAVRAMRAVHAEMCCAIVQGGGL